MTHPALVVLSALFLWWASTGAILWRVRRADLGGPDDHLWSVLLGLPLLLGGVAGLHATARDLTPGAIYLAFLSALAIWGWLELAFLSGVIAGPNRRPCPPGLGLRARFWRAMGTVLWHELALLAGLALCAQIVVDAPNRFGLWAFAVLFFARISAKLNLFLGVPRIHTEFLPRPLAHLASHFRLAPMNPVFPLSVLALTLATACWAGRAWTAADPALQTGHVLLTALTALALLEHWFMVLPLPDQKLWRWMLPDRPRAPAPAPSPRP